MLQWQVHRLRLSRCEMIYKKIVIQIKSKDVHYMKNKIHFVTLFPNCPNYGLVKDVGQIPYSLGTVISEINAELVSCKIDFDGNNLENVHGLTLTKIPFCINSFVSGLVYLLKNAKYIDWLNLFHGGRCCYYWIKIFRMLNPNGKVYLKLDLSYGGCKIYRENKKKRAIFEKTASIADIISVESEKIKEYVGKFTNVPINVVPNGYVEVSESKIGDVKRKNQFITVGRLGTYQKATDILLNAFAESSIEHNWSLKLVGPVDNSFYPVIQDYFVKYPELKKRVTFVGDVQDRAELYREYRSARTFVLPSRWEASPLVGPEALANGCRVILSDAIPPIDELTNNLEFGAVVETESIESLKNAFIKEAKRDYVENESILIKKYAKEKLSWSSICNQLYTIMMEKYK